MVDSRPAIALDTDAALSPRMLLAREAAEAQRGRARFPADDDLDLRVEMASRHLVGLEREAWVTRALQMRHRLEPGTGRAAREPMAS